MVFLPGNAVAYLSEKVVVEYTFKNSLSEKAYTIVLGQEAIVVQSAGAEEHIRYDEIRSVRLSRKKAVAYRITIYARNNRSITISNKYHLASGQCEDRSRQYSAFVRTLHYHLTKKGAPVFTSGNSFALLLVWSLIAGFFSFLLSFISEYFGWSVINPYAQSLLLTLTIVSVLLAFNKVELSKPYSPEHIPFQYLP